MKVLVTVASRHGSTRKIAEVIADELRQQGVQADLHDACDVVDVSRYDAVVLGSAVYMGNWLPDARRFFENEREDLAKLPLWLFSSGPLGSDDPKPHGDPDGIQDIRESIPAREHRVFTGKLDRKQLGFGERLIYQVLHAPEGDFRDWDAIREWARGIAAPLEMEEAAVASC